MSKFEVGETVIHVPSGEIQTILKILNDTEMKEILYGTSYFFELKPGIWYDLDMYYAHESDLRKRHPPQELSSWEAVEKDTGWNPTKQGVTHGTE